MIVCEIWHSCIVANAPEPKDLFWLVIPLQSSGVWYEPRSETSNMSAHQRSGDLDDPNRLHALVEYRVIDIPKSRQFADLTAKLARDCHAPVVYLSVVGGTRQWLFARVGLPIQETPADQVFCDSPTVMQVDNLATDPRYSDHPWVTGAPSLRALACAPLLTRDEVWIGVLCMADTVARRFTPAQIDALSSAANAAMALLERQRAVQPLHEQRFRDMPVKVCAWCKRVNVESGRWLSPEAHRLDADAYVTHGICPDCLAIEMAAQD